MSLTESTRLVFFTTSTLAESQGDDISYSVRYWDIWMVEKK
jgi:hypothetical protein